MSTPTPSQPWGWLPQVTPLARTLEPGLTTQSPLSTSPTLSVTSPRSEGRETRPGSRQGVCQVSGLPAPGHQGLVCPFPAAPNDRDSPAQGNATHHHGNTREQTPRLRPEVPPREAFPAPTTQATTDLLLLLWLLPAHLSVQADGSCGLG